MRYFLTLFLILALSPVAAGEKVVLQLKWEHEFQFAGYYAALWQGYYSAEGLDVEIKPASTPEGKLLNPVEAVTSGRAHFAIGEMDILLAKDAGHDLVILAPIFQRNPVSIFALQSTQMGNVRELAKLRIAAPKDNDTRAQVKVLFRTQGIDPDAVAFVDVAPNVTSLQAGLAAHIAINPSISQEEFERYASAVFQRETHLINVGAAPNLVVTMIYPLETNRGALGLDYRSNEAQREAVLEVKNSGEMIVAGPVNLVQGGAAFIGRTAVYTGDRRFEESFWGIVSAPFEVQDFYQSIGLLDPDLPIEIAIRGNDGLGNGVTFFLVKKAYSMISGRS